MDDDYRPQMNSGTTQPTGQLLPGRELDALVAERVMGWTFIGEHGGVLPPGMTTADTVPMPWLSAVPRYSTDIAAAWEVIEAVRKKTGLTFALFEGPTFWHAEFRHFDFWSDGVRDRATARVTNPNGAPHAICLAALKVVEA